MENSAPAACLGSYTYYRGSTDMPTAVFIYLLGMPTAVDLPGQLYLDTAACTHSCIRILQL